MTLDELSKEQLSEMYGSVYSLNTALEHAEDKKLYSNEDFNCTKRHLEYWEDQKWTKPHADIENMSLFGYMEEARINENDYNETLDGILQWCELGKRKHSNDCKRLIWNVIDSVAENKDYWALFRLLKGILENEQISEVIWYLSKSTICDKETRVKRESAYCSTCQYGELAFDEYGHERRRCVCEDVKPQLYKRLQCLDHWCEYGINTEEKIWKTK